MTIKKQHLDKDLAHTLMQEKDITSLSGKQLLEMFREEEGISKYKPDAFGHIDPRSLEPILNNPSRNRRPNAESGEKVTTDCPICDGNTTKIIDYVEFKDDFTFINKNLFPAIYPHAVPQSHSQECTEFPAWGLHLLQWTSAYHELDWHNMPVEDLSIVMKQLGVLEAYLLSAFQDVLADSLHVSIIKNGGLGSGGSLAHGHQQIILSNAIPRKAIENLNFEKTHGQVFSKFMLERNPKSLVIRDFDEVVLLVPDFMRRPGNMQLIVKDTTKKFIHQLSDAELAAVSAGWKTAILAIHQFMIERGQTVSYNVITHNGPGAGLYFEFLPRTQTEGGFEMIGLSICQSAPELVANQMRELLDKTGM